MSAAYSDGRNFNYTYDAAGNVLELQKNLGPGTVITTYTYDAANQLNTAQEGSTTWQYTYDANGSLISDGVKTYTYDSANRLIQVTDQSLVTSLSYNGLGQRLSMDAAGVIAHYVMDGDQPLTANSNGNTTFYLYGLGAIGEKTTAWSYSLPDGTNTPRQLTNPTGGITLLARYTPWGDTLDTYGTGNFTFGYFGGVMDAATGLLYVGNGQYYDPATGRFLSRAARSNNTNPYVPWDPTGAIIGPLGVAALFFRKRKKGNKAGTLLVLLLIGITVSMTMAACGNANGQPQSSTTVEATVVPIASNQAEVTLSINGTSQPAVIVTTPVPPNVIVTALCEEAPTSTPTPIGTPTPTPIDAELAQYGVYFTGITREWTSVRIEAVRIAVRTVGERFAGIIGGSGMEAFKRVYGYINFEWTYDVINGFGWTYNDHTIKWDGFYMIDYRGVRNVIHELGHMFDRKICSTRQSDGICNGDEIFHDSARTDLTAVWNTEYCGIYLCLGRTTHSGPQPGMYWGFAGDWEEWQFGATDDPGEVWADMFLGWVYDEWGDDPFGIADYKQNYMNTHMRAYLGGL